MQYLLTCKVSMYCFLALHYISNAMCNFKPYLDNLNPVSAGGSQMARKGHKSSQHHPSKETLIYNIYTMLDQRRRRCINVMQMFCDCRNTIRISNEHIVHVITIIITKKLLNNYNSNMYTIYIQISAHICVSQGAMSY